MMSQFGIDYTPEVLAVVLGICGAVALLMAILYVKDKDSALYKFMVLIGLIVGVATAFVCFTTYGMLETYTTVIVVIAAFTLIIRPFREVHFALIFAILVMAMVYVLLGDLQGGSLDVIGQGWGRVIVAVIAGALIFTFTNFIESIIKMVGKLLNWWPVLLILGIICIIEAASVYAGYSSIVNWLN